MKIKRTVSILLLIMVLSMINLSLAQDGVGSNEGLNYLSSGYELFDKGEYDSSILVTNQAIAVFKDLNDYVLLARANNLICENWIQLHVFDKADSVAKSILSLVPEKLDSTSNELGDTYFNLGEINELISDTEKSTIYYSAAVKYYLNDSKKKEKLIKTYERISQCYRYMAQYEKSIGELNLALQKCNEFYGSASPRSVIMYIGMSNAYNKMFQYDKSIEFLNMALRILEKHEYMTNEIMTTYHLIGETYILMKQFELAFQFLKKSEKYLRKIPSGYKGIMIYRELGTVHSILGREDESIEYFDRALNLAKSFFGGKHPANASVLLSKAEAYELFNNFEESAKTSHLSLLAISPSFDDLNIHSNPTKRDFFSMVLVMRSLLVKASSLKELYQTNGDLTNLEASLKTFQLADSLVLEIQKSQKSIVDKFELARFGKTSAEGCIEACLELFEMTKDTQFKEMAFFYSEKMKSSTIAESLRKASAKIHGDIPENLLSLEEEIQKEVAILNTRIAQAESNSSLDSTIVSLRKDLHVWQQRSDSLEQLFENRFPIYHESNNEALLIDVKKIQNNLKPQSLILEFFEGYNNNYLFSISKADFRVYSFKNDSIYQSTVSRFLKVFQEQNGNYSKETYLEEVNDSAQKMYSLLIDQAIDDFSKGNVIKELFIIPDGVLFYVPFDLLISKSNSNAAITFKDFNFLIKDYLISYGYSSTLAFGSDLTRTAKNGYLGFAPVYSNGLNERQISSLGQFRDEITPLKWNQHEIRNSSEIMGGSYYLAKEATESKFKEEASDYGILHMAMHTLIDNDNPMNSKFVFTLNNDSTEDGFLHAFELFNMRLSADLVVLSACNTGKGVLKHGEGSISLARGFRYAGVPNVILSLWQLSDWSASDLMIKFYEEVEKGESYASALRNAKLKYLDQSGQIMSNPFYWAAFSYVGNPYKGMSENKSSNAWLISMIVGLTIALATYVFLRKQMGAER